MNDIRYLCGAHNSDSILHLGHLYGSIIPLINNNIQENIFFLIGDTNMSEDVSNYDISIFKTCSQIYSISQIYNLKIKIIRQSTLRKYFSSYYFNITKYITKTQYKNVLTSKQQNENNFISELLYPLDTTIALLLLKINYVLFTGNDHEIISFARRIIKKYTNKNSVINVSPILYYKKDDFVKGWNYKKMGATHNNCIYVSDRNEILKKN